MELNTFQDKIQFREKPEIQNKEQLAESLITLTVGMISELGELASVLNKGAIFGKDLNLVDVADEVGDIYVYSTLMMKAMDIKAEDVLDATYNKLRLRFADEGYRKDYKHEKLFFKDLVQS